jgi:hypothetical protein
VQQTLDTLNAENLYKRYLSAHQNIGSIHFHKQSLTIAAGVRFRLPVVEFIAVPPHEQVPTPVSIICRVGIQTQPPSRVEHLSTFPLRCHHNQVEHELAYKTWPSTLTFPFTNIQKYFV